MGLPRRVPGDDDADLRRARARREAEHLFELAGDFHGLDLGALWQDMKAAGSVGLKHRSSWQRMALVTDKEWVRHGASAFGWLAPGELRLFEPWEQEAARAWVGGGGAQDSTRPIAST